MLVVPRDAKILVLTFNRYILIISLKLVLTHSMCLLPPVAYGIRLTSTDCFGSEGMSPETMDQLRMAAKQSQACFDKRFIDFVCHPQIAVVRALKVRVILLTSSAVALVGSWTLANKSPSKVSLLSPAFHHFSHICVCSCRRI